MPPQAAGGAEVSAVFLPEAKADLVFGEPRKAAKKQEWSIPKQPGVVALIYGPQGLSAGKVKKLVARNEDLLNELATYAEQTSEVENLVQELADSEDAGVPADAVLKGFASRYGVAVPKLNPSATTNQQAGVLLSALMPAANTYDPLGTADSQTQQSVGLAASLAGMFFGANVGLAAGGVALFADLRAMAFPGSEFRSAFAQASDPATLTLCTKTAAPKPRTHIVYLWAYRVPNEKPPVASLTADYVPAKSKSAIPVKGDSAALKELARARDWNLAPVNKGAAIPIEVTAPATAGAIEIDLTKAKIAPGDYHLKASWDWSPLDLGGELHVRDYGDFSHLEIPAESRDKLIAGSGVVPISVTGADFEFVEKAALEPRASAKKIGPSPAPRDALFVLPQGKRGGEQRSIEVDIDTSAPGNYLLALQQSDGVKHELPVTILPPNPQIANLPLRMNQGEAEQTLRLHGSGLDRIESVGSEAGKAVLAGDSHNGEAESMIFHLKPGLTAGREYPLELKVAGLTAPVKIENAIEVVGPRPKIVSVRRSIPGNLGIEVREDELPAGAVAGLVLSVNHLFGASGQPTLTIGCAGAEARAPLKLAPNEHTPGASLTEPGPDSLFLSLDPGVVGFPGCSLIATVSTEPEGLSDPQPLGRVVRLPKLEQLTLTNEKVGESDYAGVLKGSDLDTVAKVGWDPQDGVAVDAIPTPVPGEPAKQTLRVALPWPAPQPHAPLYVWLRNESQGRMTSVTY